MIGFKKKSKSRLDAPNRRLDNKDLKPVSDIKRDIFKRNRTIVGTRSNNVRSAANNSSNNLISDRAHVHHLSIKRRKVFSVFSMVFLAMIALFLLIINYTATPLIRLQDTSIIKSVDKAKYSTIINDYLKSNPPSRFSFILDSLKLTNYVSSVAPEVKSVTYRDMDSFGKTNFDVIMRVPVAGWKIGQKQYYVDDEGSQFEVNYFNNPEVQIVDESGISVNDTIIASKRFLSFVGQVVALSKKYSYTVIKATLPADTTRQLAIKLKENGFTVRLSIDRSVDEQVEDMDRAVKYFIKHGLKPSYIDVRVSGKAIYKY